MHSNYIKESCKSFICPGCNATVHLGHVDNYYHAYSHIGYWRDDTLCRVLVNSYDWKERDIDKWIEKANLEIEKYLSKQENAF